MTNKMDRNQGKVVTQPRLITAVLVACFAMVVSGPAVQAQFFVDAGKSARAMGMGEVFLASSSDALGYGYSPASLASVESASVGIGYGKPVAAVSELMSSQVNLILPVGDTSGLGLGVSYSGIDVASDIVASAGYGMALGNLCVGGNLKILYWSMQGQDNAYGAGTDEDLSKVSFSLDASAEMMMGAMMGFDKVSVGAYVQDAIMPNISESGADGGQIPIEVGLGLVVQQNNLVIEGDAGYNDGNTIFRAGAETPIGGSNLKIRSGFEFESDFSDELERADLGLGIGYAFSSLLFDYAYIVPFAMKATSGKHFVSFGFSF